MKRKLFLLLALMLGLVSSIKAQTDVTSTYIANPSFESDGAIATSNAALTITGWTQSDPTNQYNNTGCYDKDTNLPTQGTVTVTPSDGDYFLFFRKGWAQNTYTFTSAETTLPAGVYTLSVDYKMVEGYDSKQNNNTKVIISAKSGDNVLGSGEGTTKTNISGGNAYTYLNTADWSKSTAHFIITENTNVKVVISLQAGGQRRSDFVVDNVRLYYTPLATPIPSGTTDLYLYNVDAGQYISAGKAWGTQAILEDYGYEMTATLSNGLYKLATQQHGAYLGSDLYMDNGTAAYWAFLETSSGSGKYYLTLDGANYVTSAGAGEPLTTVTSPEDASVWTIISKADRKTELSSATIDVPGDATFLISDANFSRNVNSDVWNGWSEQQGGAKNLNMSGGTNENRCAESYHAHFSIHQNLSGMPTGVYGLTAQGFHRQDGSGNELAYFYLNSEKESFPLRTGSENSMNDASNSFSEGLYTIEPIYVRVENGNIELGAKCDDHYNLWCIWDNFQLKYYGDVTVAAVKMKAPVDAYNAAMGEATAFTEGSMWADAWTALQSAIAANTVDLNDPSLTKEVLDAATANLVAANAAATVAVARRTTYDAAVALINGGTNVDLTSIVSNASFEDGNLNGWTSVDGGGVANNNNWPGKVGTYFVERWTWYGDTQTHLSDGTLTHDALVLPAGLYTITANAQNQEQKNGKPGTGYFLCANEEKAEISASNTYSTTVLLEEDKSELVIKFALEGCTGNWISCDDVHLTYVGEDFPAYTLVTGKMNAEVAAAQTAADEAFQANKNVANYNALTAAIAAAQASKDAYTAAGTAIANANNLKEAHNLASATAYSTFAEAIAAIETPYNANTLSTADANAAGLALGTVVTGWHAAAESAAVAYLNDAFSLHAFDAALYINTWSIEGETDGSNFKVPFYEYWTGDGDALAKKTWTGQVTGLSAGTYKVSAWVRVRAKSGTAAIAATGITMDVNGATAVDVTEGTQVGTSQFQLAEYEATGYVLSDGVLKVNFNIADGNNISWLSYKNISYTRTGDLPATVSATIGATGWTTFASPCALDLSDMTASEGAVTAFYASDADADKVSLSSTEDAVTAGTGLMLKGTAGATITIPVVASGSAIVGNMLVGCTNDTPLAADESIFVLVNNEGKAEFQSLKTNGATIPAGKAYLNAPVNAARLVISIDGETAINAIEAADAEAEGLKDGKYLIEGKIVIVNNGVKYSANGQILK